MRPPSRGRNGFILVVVWVTFFSRAESCRPGEYMVNELCCPMCNSGTVVKTHCTAALSNSVCIPCVDGTYMDHPNGLSKCLKCTECDSGAGLVENKKCTYTSNTECECKTDYYCSSSNIPCDDCSPQTMCKAGEYVKEKGTSTRNNVCEKCPDGHFSDANMSKTCTAWTRCSEQGRIEKEQGTATSDSVCVDWRERIGLIIAGSVFGIVTFIFLIKTCLKTQENTEINTPDVHDVYVKGPVQEEGA